MKLDHHLWNEFKKYKLQNEKVLVAVSGGVDSVALANSCFKVLGPDKVSIAHFHHGGSSEFRNQSQIFCRDWAQSKGLRFFSEKREVSALKNSDSEASMRKARYEFLLKTAEEQKIPIVMTAHHAQDVLETRMIRLIRGVGPQGLRAIRVFRRPFFRPFLKISKPEIELYVNKEGLKFLTDPSNRDNHYLRNWLRSTWLAAIEEKRPGSVRVMAQSLETIVMSLARHEVWDITDKINRGEFLAKTQAEQMQLLARVLLHLGRKNFTQFHLEEIRRRVVESPKNNSFKVAGCQWLINAEQIQVQLAI